MPSSKGGRSYSDPTYGSVRSFVLGPYTAGTRATAIVAQSLYGLNTVRATHGIVMYIKTT